MKSSTDPTVHLIAVQFSSICLTCEEPVGEGDKAYWCPGVGVWHYDCLEPRNLKLMWKEAQRVQQLKLENL